MKASLDYIKKKFAEYNTQMFEGKLQQLPFKLSPACSRLFHRRGTQQALQESAR